MRLRGYTRLHASGLWPVVGNPGTMGPYCLPVPRGPEGPFGSKTAALPYSVGFSHLSMGYLDSGLRTSLLGEIPPHGASVAIRHRAFTVGPPRGWDGFFFDGGPVIQVERLFMNQVATWVSIRTLSVEGRVRNHSAIAPT